LPAGSTVPKEYEAYHFCDNEKDANELADLVLAGIKGGTASLLCEYEYENEKIPEVGDFVIVTNWKNEPVCIFQTTHVELKEFSEVDSKFAYDEGEGDRSLEYWRRVHIEAFSRSCEDINKKFDQSMTVICERFRVVFPDLK
jgi:uncharacterized protein YhfF